MNLSEKFNDLEIEETANNGELFSKIKDSKWDVIILDLNMLGRSGFEA
jgi:DNA-binding NarL/FixJ family response regulator